MTALWLALAGLAAAGAAAPVISEMRRRPVDAARRKAAPGRFAKLSQGLTHYRWVGPPEGPVAVCVHGLTTPSFVWDGVAQALVAHGYRVLVYDLYGRGYSARPTGAQTPEFFTTQLRDLLDHLGVQRDVTLLGYSMGGVIGAAFADSHGARLRRLILLAPAGLGHAPDALTRWAMDWRGIGDWAFHLGFPRAFRRAVAAERGLPSSVPDICDQQLAQLETRGYVRAVLSSLRGCLRRPIPDIHRRLAQSGLPVVAIWGQDDKVIPLDAMDRLAQLNPQARQEVIAGAGHGLPYTHTDAVAHVLPG
ncbi:alpha/beta fold hydrolase [Thalassococcus sp. BH17M4-6]|uniref:alpha/beta fold hydrolase n=1 Tax=Thalassococcus sp. BH17M4-6 TaxID=3413148 RepID=UPI003BD984E6